MRTVKLTHEEIETILTALEYVFNQELEIIKQNRKILGEDAVFEIIKSSRKFSDAQGAFDGERDI